MSILFKQYNVYMHKNAMDVAFQPCTIEFLNETHVEVNGNWYNLGYMGRPWFIDSSNFILSLDETKDWVDVTETMFNKRENSGLP